MEKIRQTLNSILKQIDKITWIFALAIFIFMISVFSIIGLSDLPSFQELENPKYDLASIVYDVNGVQFGRYFVENRVPVEFQDLSPHLKAAVVSTEDDRFYNHSGIDLRALFRVGIKTFILRQESSGGGSTISQQLAKLLFIRPNLKNRSFFERTYLMIVIKLKEWVTATKLERSYTKEEILALYLNKFEFINGAHGIQSAAQIYFGKNQEDLEVHEAAMLVGMLKNPSYFNPMRFEKRTKERRDLVIEQLFNAKYITKEEKLEYQAKEIDMSSFRTSAQSEGPAPYFRVELTKWLKELFTKENIRKNDSSEYNIYTDGLKIYTTIDLEYQKYAEEAVFEHMEWNQKRFDRVWKNRDPWTYEADDIQKKIRADILESKNKNSDRYLSLRNNYLNDALLECKKLFPEMELSDNIIKYLVESEKSRKSIQNNELFSKFTKDQKNNYQNFLKLQAWENLKDSYNQLQKNYEKEFSTPVKMKVFKYSENQEVELEMSPYDSVRYHNMHLQAGVLAVDPVSGHIKAWVGGINHKYFKFDHVTMRRSVGSTIKPFVYTQAMAIQGISPCQEYYDIQYTISPGDAGFEVNKEWSPANATETFTGNKYNLFHGLLYSKNSITVKLIKEMGTVEPIRNLLHNLGVNKELKLSNGSFAVPNLPSVSLGAADLTLIEMTGAYTAFANNGTYTQPVFVSKIEDKNGKVIYNATPTKKSAINPLYNAVMVEMLKNNVGGRFRLSIKSEIGGKTGTTNDYSDGWFMGITPALVVGVWTGGDDKWIRFLSLDDGQGYVMARPIAEKLLKKLESSPNKIYDSEAKFAKPPPGFEELINCEKFKQISVGAESRTILSEKLKREDFDDEF